MLKINYTSRDFESIKSDLIANLTSLAPELTNRSESEFAMVMINLFSYIGDILSYSLDKYANEAFLETALQRESVIKLCKLVGYILSNAKPARVLAKFSYTGSEVLTNNIVIPTGTKISTSGTNPIIFETEENAIIDIINSETYVEVWAVQGETKDETLGYSDYSQNQEFTLTYGPLLDGLELYVNQNLWSEVDSFYNSTSISDNYIIDNYAKIKFGDGVNGMIPEDSARIYAYYRIGGGEIGNVGINSINEIIDQIFDTEGNYVDVSVNNEAAATGGKEKESIESAKLNAPKSFKADRAVTKDDYETLATSFEYLNMYKIIKAVATRHETNITEIIIHVWSDYSGYISAAPAAMKTALKNFLDTKSLIGITNTINDGTITPIPIVGAVHLKPGYTESVVKPLVDAAIIEFFDYNNFNPGNVIATSLITKAINSVEGVLYFDLTTPVSNITLGSTEMPSSTTNTITYV